ncbi:MAG: hypothetical protein WCS03_18915 [Bacteroidota bacterium]
MKNFYDLTLKEAIEQTLTKDIRMSEKSILDYAIGKLYNASLTVQEMHKILTLCQTYLCPQGTPRSVTGETQRSIPIPTDKF